MIELSLNEIPTEKDCIDILKLIREENGFICKKCKHNKFYWKNDKNEFECKNCKNRISLKVNTIMHRSKLPISFWVITLDIIIFSEYTIKEIQSFFDIRYQTIYNIHLIISTQLKRYAPQDIQGLISVEELPIEKKAFILKSSYLDNECLKQEYDKEIIKLYLNWLSQPLIKLD